MFTRTSGVALWTSAARMLEKNKTPQGHAVWSALDLSSANCMYKIRHLTGIIIRNGGAVQISLIAICPLGGQCGLKQDQKGVVGFAI
jgi:S-ribosylhomocysteine lyase LuxS involved in autoinducer biosynthesis